MGNPAWQDTLWSTEDYRVFLRSWYEQKKASRPNFSLRVLGNKLFMDPSLLSKIFQGERHLATSRIQPVCDLVGLTGNHAEYFRHLVLHAKSKTAREAQALFERMQELRRVAPVQLDDAQESYWDSWVHLALRSLLTCGDFKDDWKTLGDLLRPRQSANAAKKAMKALERLDLVAKDDDGFWRPNDPFVRDRPGSQIRALRNFHRQSMLLAMASLEGMDPSQRDISAVTITIDDAEYAELVKSIEDMRSRTLSRAAKVRRPTRVVQLNLQLIPLSKAVTRPGQGNA